MSYKLLDFGSMQRISEFCASYDVENLGKLARYKACGSMGAFHSLTTMKAHGVKFLGVEGVSPSDFEDRL
ncbi:MAG: hypothetical protein ACLUJY_04910 [Adlercreutzia equolifaciens subsp. celatus]|uniref:hypothetical protein n=1 Tax=Adlercreutzia equolifaciens TaxID=446660 RepID=UPI003991C935